MPRRTANDPNKPIQHRGIFFTDLEDKFLGAITEELFVEISQEFILYYQIDEERSQQNVYGEHTRRVFRNPIKIFCYIEPEEPTLVTNRYGVDEERNITVYFHKRRLEEIGVKIMEGDFLEYNGLSYFIFEALDTRKVLNNQRFRDTIRVRGKVPGGSLTTNT